MFKELQGDGFSGGEGEAESAVGERASFRKDSQKVRRVEFELCRRMPRNLLNALGSLVEHRRLLHLAQACRRGIGCATVVSGRGLHGLSRLEVQDILFKVGHGLCFGRSGQVFWCLETGTACLGQPQVLNRVRLLEQYGAVGVGASIGYRPV